MIAIHKTYSNGFVRELRVMSAVMDEDGEVVHLSTENEGIVLAHIQRDADIFQQLYANGLLTHDA